MQNRTIKDLHDKYIGHRKFAKVCDILIQQNYEISKIKEYNEKFKFQLNGYNVEYEKNWKASALCYVEWITNLLASFERIKELRNKTE